MAERITRDDVAHVAGLARLALTDDELDMFTEQLAKVLDHAADVERDEPLVLQALGHVTLDDAATADELFSVLMGEDVEARRNFIIRNAKDVRFLDI